MLFYRGRQRVLDANGNPVSGALANFYLSGTTTRADTYTDAALTIANTNPVVADAYGFLPPIYLDPSVTYKSVITTAAAVSLPDGTIDPVIQAAFDQDALGAILYPRTPAEIAASVTPVNYAYPYGHAKRWGILGDGSDETTKVTNWLASAADGCRLILTEDLTNVSTTGSHSITKDRVTIQIDGVVTKRGTTLTHLFNVADETDGITFEGSGILDGNKSAFASGNPVCGIGGYYATHVTVRGSLLFRNFIDNGVKLRDCGWVTIAPTVRFEDCDQGGVELANYVVDVRTGSAPTSTRPTIEGGHDIGGIYRRIDDNLHGAGNGNAIFMHSINTSYPIRDVRVHDFLIEDCLRGIWSEQNVSGSEALDITICNGNIRGDVYGTNEVKDGIGLVDVKRATISNVTMMNVGNFAPGGGTCAGIQLSSAENIIVTGCPMVETRGSGNRMDYAVVVAAGCSEVNIQDCPVGGQTDGDFNVSASANNVKINRCPGAVTYNSWGSTITVSFTITNIAASTTASGLAGQTGMTEFLIPSPFMLVGMGVVLSTPITAGTMTITPVSDGVDRTNLNITEATFASGVAASSAIATSSGVAVAAAKRVAVNVTTNGAFTPAGSMDITITLILDVSNKR